MSGKNAADCNKHQEIQEYTYFQQFVDNLPYIAMALLGAAIFVVGLQRPFWGYLTAGLYVLYSIVGSLWIIIFVCPYCHFFDTMACPCGYGRIAAKFRPRHDGDLFMKKFKKNIPVIFPLWIAPVAAGVTFLISGFSLLMLVLLSLFAVNSFAILPLLSRKYGCAHCPQRDTCPWMNILG